MREWLNNTASRVDLRRRILLLITSFLLALFMVAGPLVQTSSAADQIKASWNGDTVSYDGHDYALTTSAPGISGSQSAYQWVKKGTSGNKDTAYVIYFSSEAKTATAANLVLYSYTAPTSYTDASPPLALTVVPAGTTDPGDLSGSSTDTSCDARYFGGLGWLICSVSHWVADGVDGVYQIIKQFLEVSTITESDNGIFQIWQMVLALANVSFIIVFLIIVYSHLTSIGISNYSIKDMVPRLIIAAVLVNFSFWICQFFVDISNVLGYSIQSIFTGIQDKLNINVDINWGDITNYILSGGTIVAGTLGFVAVAAGSFGYLGFTLLGALLTVGFSVLVAFIILAARQAIIVVLVMLAPLAFIAMVLPSTKSLFDKWRKTFTTLLLFFPIFAVLFGGAELAGAAIINSQYHNLPGGESSGSLTMIIIGMAVQFVPLAITPFIIQFSSGLLGRIAGLANDRKRGLVDRAKAWTQSNADDFRTRKLANSAMRRDLQRPGETRTQRAFRSVRPANMALALDRSRSNRERRIQRNKDYLEHRNEANEIERINNPHTSNVLQQNFNARQRQQMLASHEHHERTADHKKEIESEGREHMAHLRQNDTQLNSMRRRTALNEGRADVVERDMKAADEVAVQSMIHRDNHLRHQSVRTKIRENEAASYKAVIDAEGDEAWKNREQTTGYLRVMRRNTDLAKKRTADIDASMSAEDQRVYDTLVNQAPTTQYQHLRNMKVQTIRDQKHAELNASQVQAEGERSYYADFEDGNVAARQLRKQFNAIEQTKKESATIGDTLQKRADAHWDRVSRLSGDTQALRLRQEEAAESANLSKTQYEQFIENVKDNGEFAAGVYTQNRTLANAIQHDHSAADIVERSVQDLKAASAARSEQEYIESDEGRRQRQRTQAAKDTLEGITAEEAARIEEMRTEKGAQDLTGEEAEIARELREADFMKRTQTQRNANASTVATQEYASAVLDGKNIPGTNEKITDIASGIAGTTGVSQSRATAKQTVVEGFNKAVGAEKTLVSRATEQEILANEFADPQDPDTQVVGLGSKDILDEPEERISALGGAIASRYHMESHIKLWDRLGQLGRQANKEMRDANKMSEDTDAERIAKKKAQDDAKEKLGKVKSLQQQVMGDKTKKPFGIGDSDLGKANVGQYEDNIYDGTRKRIGTHLSVESLATMDPDDMRLIFEMARARKLSPEKLQTIKNVYAAWEKDPIHGSKLQPKHRRFLDPIVNDDYSAPGDSDLQKKKFIGVNDMEDDTIEES